MVDLDTKIQSIVDCTTENDIKKIKVMAKPEDMAYSSQPDKTQGEDLYVFSSSDTASVETPTQDR